MEHSYVREGSVKLLFEEGSRILKYDDSHYFRSFFCNTAGGSKGVDAICIARAVCWLVEIKAVKPSLWEDQRFRVRDVVRRAALQVRDTLAGLASASVRAEEGEGCTTFL